MFRKIIFLLVISLIISHPIKAQKEYKANSDVRIKAADSELCVLSAMRMEDKYGIKPHLLKTISNIETGQWDHQKEEFVSWPWTINANGKGYHFKTKEEAVSKVKELQASGITSIDVGCMQVNLKYHADAFDSIEDALDPDKNMEYSARFLNDLYSKKGDWQKAAMAYHSKVPSRGRTYGKKLLSRFEQIKYAFLDAQETVSLF